MGTVFIKYILGSSEINLNFCCNSANPRPIIFPNTIPFIIRYAALYKNTLNTPIRVSNRF